MKLTNEIPELKIFTVRITGLPIRVVAVLLLFAALFVGGNTLHNGMGALIGGILGLLNMIILLGFATIVDACNKYLKSK